MSGNTGNGNDAAGGCPSASLSTPPRRATRFRHRGNTGAVWTEPWEASMARSGVSRVGVEAWASWVRGRVPKGRAAAPQACPAAGSPSILCGVTARASGVGPCQVPPVTVVGAQTPSQLLQSLPFPFCFPFSWVLRDGMRPAGGLAASPSLLPSVSLPPTPPPSSSLPRGRAGRGSPGQGGDMSGELPWAPRVPWRCLAEREAGPVPGSRRFCSWTLCLNWGTGAWSGESQPSLQPGSQVASRPSSSSSSCEHLLPSFLHQGCAARFQAELGRRAGLAPLLPAGLYRGYIERRSALEPAPRAPGARTPHPSSSSLSVCPSLWTSRLSTLLTCPPPPSLVLPTSKRH